MAGFNAGSFKIALTAATTTTGGDAAGVANPEGVRLYVTRVIVDITTPATGAAALDVGIAADATTSADNLIDGCDVGTAAAIFDNANGTDNGTNGDVGYEWDTDEFLTATPSATLAGLVGNIYVEFIRLE